MSALPAERGKGLWKTPSEAHSRIWQSRGWRESGNVEGISLRTGKWRGAEKTPGEGPGRGAGPECRRVQGGAALPGQGDPHSHPQPHPPAARQAEAQSAPRPPPASAPRGGEPAAPPPPPRAETLRLCWKPSRAPAPSSPACPPPQLARAERLPREGTSWCTEAHARLYCRTGLGAAGGRTRETRAPATPQGPARIQGGRPAASALSAPHPAPSCPHPTLPRLLPSQPTPAPRPPGGRRKEHRERAPSGDSSVGGRLTAPPTSRQEQRAPPARFGPFILRCPPALLPASQGLVPGPARLPRPPGQRRSAAGSPGAARWMQWCGLGEGGGCRWLRFSWGQSPCPRTAHGQSQLQDAPKFK